MRIEDSFTIAHPPTTVWRYVRQVPLVATCLPGAELLEQDDASGRFKGRLSIKLGPIAAAFDGEGEAHWDDATHSGTVKGQGRDGRSASRVQGELGFRLTPSTDGRGTTVALGVDYTLTGALAQFGRSGIVADVARRLTRDFARAFEARINAELAASVPENAVAPSVADANRPASIDAGRLLWTVVWERLSRWLRRLVGQS
ncbi:MAG: SRPBCC family protein [Alphaproteobacteria bacterium]